MKTLPILLFFIFCSFTSVFAQMDCARIFSGLLPFIGKDECSFQLTPKYSDEIWTGVECTHGEEKSPHLIGTHIESSRHVFGSGKALKRVIETKPAYLNTMKGLHVAVRYKKETVAKIVDLQNDQKIVTFESGDTYSLVGPFNSESLERVITRQTVELAFAQHILSDAAILLLQIEGGEKLIKDWPYLTNEASMWIKEKGFQIIALNIPSMDREVDGGRTSNHKVFFQDEDHLIIESADFSNIPIGSVGVKLILGDLNAFVDCACCEHLYVYP